MTFSLITDPKEKLLYIIAFFLLLYMMVALTGLPSHLSPDVIESLFFAYPVWGIVLFCLAFSFGNLWYGPGWVFLVWAALRWGEIGEGLRPSWLRCVL